jgi:hypothetical protein
MHKFFSIILKQKKIFLSIFLVIFILGTMAPNIVSADWSSSIKSGVGWFLCPACKVIGTIDEPIKKALGVEGSPIMNSILWAATIIPLTASSSLADLAGTLLKWIVSETTKGNISYIKSTAVQYGWPSIRDLANMLIVLGFVVIGIAFTLRLEGYGSKKALINLIIVALLVNFSL